MRARSSSPEGRDYLAAMAAAANFAWANRAVIAHRVREAIGAGPRAARSRSETRQVYDVAHNVAKLERHGDRALCVHRKGATRAFPPGHPEIPAGASRSRPGRVHPREHGNALVRPGRARGIDGRARSGPCATGRAAGSRAPRRASRSTGGDLRRALEGQGIVVRAPSARGLAEEAPEAYKDVDRVVEIVERAGLAARVARLRPIGVVKG